MPGITYAGGYSGNNGPPLIQRFFTGNSLTGNDTSTTPGAMYSSDPVVLTSNTTYTTSPLSNTSPISIRKLTYTDIANGSSSNGITNTTAGGILGVSTENFTTNANGQFSSVPGYGLLTTPIPFAVPNPSSLWFPDTYTLKSQVPVFVAGRGNSFKGRISPLYTSAAMGSNLNNTQAGLVIITGLAAPTLVQGTTATVANSGGTIVAGTYYIVVTFTNSMGETTQSNVISVTATGTAVITVVGTSGVLNTSTATNNIAVNYKVYIGSSAAGPFYLQNGTGTALGTSYTLSTPPVTNTATPPTGNTTGAIGVSQYYILPGASALCLRILEANVSDPLYGTTFSAGNLQPGVEYAFTFNLANCQDDPANNLGAYTT